MDSGVWDEEDIVVLFLVVSGEKVVFSARSDIVSAEEGVGMVAEEGWMSELGITVVVVEATALVAVVVSIDGVGEIVSTLAVVAGIVVTVGTVVGGVVIVVSGTVAAGAVAVVKFVWDVVDTGFVLLVLVTVTAGATELVVVVGDGEGMVALEGSGAVGAGAVVSVVLAAMTALAISVTALEIVVDETAVVVAAGVDVASAGFEAAEAVGVGATGAMGEAHSLVSEGRDQRNLAFWVKASFPPSHTSPPDPLS